MKIEILVFATLCGIASAARFQIYSCPLVSTDSILSSTINKDCSNNRRRGLNDVYAPYLIRHTYLQIGTMCYDWGDWNYTRSIPCTDAGLACCAKNKRLEYTGDTSCASQVYTFETAWRNQHKTYDLLTWNCQKYSDSMKKFLEGGCYNVEFVGK